MTNYDAPGVYVENVPAASPPIQGVGTSTALFIAPCPGASAPMHVPKSITNYTEFLTHFGSDKSGARHLANATKGFFENGGQKVYIIAVEDDASVAGDAKKKTGLWAARGLDEPAIVACPGVTDIAAQKAVMTYCEEMRDRFCILDAPEKVTDLDQLTKMASIKASSGEGEAASRAQRGGGLKPGISDQGFGSFNYPWISVIDQQTRKVVYAPPSGHLAGVYARTDALRGVHKAPANESVRGALGLKDNVSKAELGMLNRNGVNVIREFPSRGIRIFGARTLADQSSEWRYVNVKRFLIFVEESLQLGLMSAVFQPNDRFTQASLKMRISSFLLTQWRDGALVGATPEEAFFVKCDAENNPPDVVEKGQIRVDVGLAVSRPAEFVIVRLSQWNGADASAE
ncbi:phage tail sheath family protein [Parasulfitobacter algicola]|uniref:Phage tail sheath family protein n=1 Tax=Parasulfitobacter algicola TaxID=2614809 RepID=A0ABX2IYP8_9RHOB|nr:phage tail sheath subtilisin-like domain-containing protein [Sulfitobacter algicola]NSX55761.1 phage tail sheath family protein [Sulfitobacter algicola]